jgi:diguanylate cyclase (GGDEF)-like protein/PAS domain S-box-containing protein
VEHHTAARAERMLEAVMARITDQIYVIGADGRFRWASPSAVALFGVEEWDGREVGAFVHPDDLPAIRHDLHELLQGRLTGPLDRVFRVWSDPLQTWRWIEASCSDHRDDPALDGLLVCSRDVTDRVVQADALREQALHDALTGLPNRSLLLDRIANAALRAVRGGTDLAVLFFDLDHFKQVNDTLGHAAGDRLLLAVTERVRARLRAQDTFGRLGGDEFVIVLEGLERPSDAAVASVCDDLVSALSKPLQVDGHQLRITSSVGVVVSSGTDAAEELLRAADVAMYAAKAGGRGRWELHTDALSAAARTRFEVHERMLEALDTGGFDLHYQPIVDLKHGHPLGVEAFVRLRTTDGTILSPDQFLPVAEDHGLIGRIGSEVLTMATRDCVHLSGMVAVNVSPTQLADPDFERMVVRALSASGLDPHRLVLDVTESAVLETPTPETTRNLNRLRARGVRFALDDFGSGYSSLDRVRHLPVSFIKIDRTFVDGLTTVGSGDLAVVRAVVGMAASLGIPVVAEGVEDELQRDVLLRVGVQLAQGHLFARAAPLAELLRSPALTTGVPVTTRR